MDAAWDAIVSQVSSLGLTVPQNQSQLIPVVKRKLVRALRQAGLDSVCQITVFRPEQPERVRYLSFNAREYTYQFIIAIVYPGNQDNLSNVGVYASHREKIKQAFEVFSYYPPLGVTGIIDMRIAPDVYLPRSMLALNYDYQAIGVTIKATA